MSTLVDKSKLDVVKIFLHYVASVGDVERTALACDLSAEVVRSLVLSEGWEDKIKRITLVSKSGGLQAGDFERMQNRAVAWVQGHRLRQVMDRVVCRLHEMEVDDVIAELTKTDRDGNKSMSARLFSDLAKAIETVNGLCFAALGDTVPERKPASAGGAASAAELHASLIAALNSPTARKLPSDTLVTDVAQAIDSVPNCPTPERKALPAVATSENQYGPR